MLVIRLQRTGRSGHAQFRVVVQDSRFSPTSGRVVSYVGSYDPHSKEAKLDVEKISAYMSKGAQPSPRVVKLLKAQKVKLPGWVKEAPQQKREVRNPDKRRSTRPEASAEEAPVETAAAEATPAAEAPVESPTVEEAVPAEPAPEATSEAPVEQPAEPAEPSTEEIAAEVPAEEVAPEPEASAEEVPAEPEAEAPAEQ